MSQEQRKQELLKLLFNRFNSLLLSKKEFATIIGKSTSTIDRLAAREIGPNYIKDESSQNGSVDYPIDSVIEWIIERETKITLKKGNKK